MTATPTTGNAPPPPGNATCPAGDRKGPAVSVVVPVYNVLPYLDRCLESLCRQTFRDFETILVDDGSTDGSGKRCDEWVPRLPGGRVVHQKNGGLANARNTGVAAATGKWVAFVDSDDFVAPEYLECLFGMIRDHHVTLSACGMQRTTGDSLSDDPASALGKSAGCSVSAGRSDSLRWLHSQKLTDTMWGKMFLRDILLAVPQPDGRVHEDTSVIAQIVYLAERVAVASRPLYGYFVNGSSIIHSAGPGRLRDQVWAYRDRARFYHSVNEPEFERLAWKQTVGTLWTDAREGLLSVRAARELWRTSGLRVFDTTSLKCRAFLLFPRTYRFFMQMKRSLRRLMRH